MPLSWIVPEAVLIGVVLLIVALTPPVDHA